MNNQVNNQMQNMDPRFQMAAPGSVSSIPPQGESPGMHMAPQGGPPVSMMHPSGGPQGGPPPPPNQQPPTGYPPHPGNMQPQMMGHGPPNPHMPPGGPHPMHHPGPPVMHSPGPGPPPQQMQHHPHNPPPPQQQQGGYTVHQPVVFNQNNPNAPPIFLCGHCRKEVTENDQPIQCEAGCKFWFHRLCSGLTNDAYTLLRQDCYAEWICNLCMQKMPQIPFIKFKT